MIGVLLIALVACALLLATTKRSDKNGVAGTRRRRIRPMFCPDYFLILARSWPEIVHNMRNFTRTYWDHGMCSFNLSFLKTCMIWDPLLLEEVANSPHIQMKGIVYRVFFGDYVDGVFTHPGGADLKVLKKPMSKSMSKKYLDGVYYNIMLDKCNSLVQYIKQKRSGPYLVEEDIGAAVLDIYTRTHLGVDLNELWERKWNYSGVTEKYFSKAMEPPLIQLYNNVKVYSKLCATFQAAWMFVKEVILFKKIFGDSKMVSEQEEDGSYYDPNGWRGTSKLYEDLFFIAQNFMIAVFFRLVRIRSVYFARKYKKDDIVMKAYKLVDRILEERSQPILKPLEEGLEYYTDFLLRRAKEMNSYETARMELADTLAAGSETILSVVSSAAIFLAMHPEVQEEAFREQVAVLGQPFREPTALDLSRMECLERIEKETTRIVTPSMLMKFCTNTEVIGDHLIEKGTFVITYIAGMMNHPKYWERPDEFYPDHFLPEKEAARPKFVFSPYGLGIRKCPGFQYGSLLVKMMLSTLIRNFKITTEMKWENVEYHYGLLLAVKDGYVNMEPR